MILDVESLDLLLSTRRWVGSSDTFWGVHPAFDLIRVQMNGRDTRLGRHYWSHEEAFWHSLERNHLSSYVVIYKR